MDCVEVDFFMFVCLYVCIPDITRVCFLWAGRPDHPNRAMRQDTQVVLRMNSTALSVSRTKA